jgi:methylated-DNA-[protein]-cysteine S-methyltransferase
MADHTFFRVIDSPVGKLLLGARAGGLTAVYFEPHAPEVSTEWCSDDASSVSASATLDAACAQLAAYFTGTLTTFHLPLSPTGTVFQCRVWDTLRRIPFGESTTYGELARRIGTPHAARAVGAANGRNPLPIIVPCHRVIGADGTLTGFGGGIERKHWLLEHERAVLLTRGELSFALL